LHSNKLNFYNKLRPNTTLQDYAWGTNGLDNILTALLNQVADQEQNTALRPEGIY